MPITLSAINANGDEPIENDRGVIINYSLPVWTVNTNPDNGNGGSVWPALFSGQQARAALQLMVQVGNDWNGILFSVAGVLNGATLFQSGTVNLAPGPATISVGATFATPALFTAVGDVAWWVVPQQGAAVPLATTRLELIWIYGPMPGFFGNRNYVYILRVLLAAAGQSQAPNVAASQIANMCFSGTNKFYDTRYGRPAFGCTTTGGNFNLSQYWRTAREHSWSCNCYDQAGCVQTMLGAIGLQCTWEYMIPFGYITSTTLIGWPGPCNTPFFISAGTAQSVGENDPARTGFGNHAFILFNGQIMDACAGPHVGTENKDAYVAAAIDTVTTLTACPTGVVGNIGDYAGLGSLTMGRALEASPVYGGSALALLGEEGRVRRSLAGGGARPDWTKLARSLERRHRLVPVDRDLFPSLDGVRADWRWRSGESGVRLTIFRAADPQAAFSRLLEHLEAFQNDPARCLERDPAFGPAGLRGRDGGLVLFVRSDFFVTVSAPPGEAEAMARQIDDSIRRARSEPRPFRLSDEERSLRVGERIEVGCGAKEIFHLDGRAVRLIGRSGVSLKLAGREPGTGELRLGDVDQRRLDLDARTIRFYVAA